MGFGGTGILKLKPGLARTWLDYAAASGGGLARLSSLRGRLVFLMATMSGGTNLAMAGTSQPGTGANAHRKKEGIISARFWESPDTLIQLDSVRQWIGKHYKKVGSLGASRLAAPC